MNNAPVTIGEKLKILIEHVNSKGEGIAKKDDFFIFVKGATRGECSVQITEVKRTYAAAEII